jgi:hypothetical protein
MKKCIPQEKQVDFSSNIQYILKYTLRAKKKLAVKIECLHFHLHIIDHLLFYCLQSDMTKN